MTLVSSVDYPEPFVLLRLRRNGFLGDLASFCSLATNQSHAARVYIWPYTELGVRMGGLGRYSQPPEVG